MNEFLPILGSLAVLTFIGFQIAAPLLMKRRVENISTLRTEELRDIFYDPSKCIFFGAAAKELEKRNESLAFTFPAFLDLALSQNMTHAIFGKNGLKAYFPEAVKDIDLEKAFLSKVSKAKLQRLKDQVGELTKT